VVSTSALTSRESGIGASQKAHTISALRFESLRLFGLEIPSNSVCENLDRRVLLLLVDV